MPRQIAKLVVRILARHSTGGLREIYDQFTGRMEAMARHESACYVLQEVSVTLQPKLSRKLIEDCPISLAALS